MAGTPVFSSDANGGLPVTTPPDESASLDDMGAAALARAIRARTVSPREVMAHTIARVEARNPSLNAIIMPHFEDAMAAAERAEAAVMTGAPLGPLHGVPTALKDLFGSKPGWVGTFGGVRAMRDTVLDYASGFTQRIEAAGAIPIGKTNSPVMGFRGTCDNPLFGPTRNPFDLTKNSGGSSGGSAAAVADGLLTFAEATDGGGSIRIPAAWCGVYGFKPSFGRTPVLARPNAFAAAMPFISEGPVTRTVADAALVMDALAGPHPRDPFSLPDRVDFAAALDRPLAGWRILYSPNFDVFPVERRVAAVVGEAVKAFCEAGAEVEEGRLGIARSHIELTDLWCRLIMPGSLNTLQEMRPRLGDLLTAHRDDFPPRFLAWADRVADRTVAQLQADLALRTEVFDALQSTFERYDLILTPTTGCLPVTNRDDGDTLGPDTIEGEAVDPLIGWCMTHPVNFTGHPAASVPAGLADGLPVGLQIIGRPAADGDVIAASAAFERLRPWAHHYRECAARPLNVLG